MGDLDEFFAKKDKKGKTKTKIVAASLFDDKKKESEAKKEKLKKKQELENIEQTPDVLKKTKEDDDWEDFDDPSGLNLAGLKVVNLAEKAADDRASGGAQDGETESGDGCGAAGGPPDDGPWRRKAEAAAAAAAEATAAAAAAATSAAAAATATAASDDAAGTPAVATDADAAASVAPQRARYEPPHKRTAAAAVSGSTGGVAKGPGDVFQARPLPRRQRDKNAPNINDVEEFPTLAVQGTSQGGGGGGPGIEEAAAEERPFESVRETSGGRVGKSLIVGGGGGGSGSGTGGGIAKPEAVSVSNRWAALGEDATS